MALFGKKKKEELLKDAGVREQIKQDVAKAEASDDGGQAFFNSVANTPDYILRGQVLQQNARMIELLGLINENLMLVDQHLRELKDVALKNDSEASDDGGF